MSRPRPDDYDTREDFLEAENEWLIWLLKESRRTRDEARSFARGVYRWGPREQWAGWEEAMPWLKEPEK